jgi:hypothetical protein
MAMRAAKVALWAMWAGDKGSKLAGMVGRGGIDKARMGWLVDGVGYTDIGGKTLKTANDHGALAECGNGKALARLIPPCNQLHGIGFRCEAIAQSVVYLVKVHPGKASGISGKGFHGVSKFRVWREMRERVLRARRARSKARRSRVLMARARR